MEKAGRHHFSQFFVKAEDFYGLKVKPKYLDKNGNLMEVRLDFLNTLKIKTLPSWEQIIMHHKVHFLEPKTNIKLNGKLFLL